MDSENNDIRWKQRFENYQKALSQLGDAVSLSKQRELTNLEKQGLIQGFEYTHELAWKVMQDYFKAKGEYRIHGSKDATRLAFRNEIIIEGEIWMDMIEDRNQSSHTYNEDVAEKITAHILGSYVEEFEKFSSIMENIVNQ